MDCAPVVSHASASAVDAKSVRQRVYRAETARVTVVLASWYVQALARAHRVRQTMATGVKKIWTVRAATACSDQVGAFAHVLACLTMIARRALNAHH